MKNDIIIKDATVEKTLQQDGWMVVPALNANDMAELHRLYETYFPKFNVPGKFNFNSNADIPSEVRVKISSGVEKVFRPHLDRLFGNYKFVVGLIFIKQSSSDPMAEVGMHFDPTLLMDEHKNRHINMWCPLMDVEENSGAMQVISGSHMFFPAVHGKTIPFPFSKITDSLYEVKECVCMKAGEALFFDNRIIHMTKPNLSGKTRISVILTIVAPEAQYISLYRDPNRKDAPIEVYYQDDGYHLHPLFDNSFERPRIGRRVGNLDYDIFYVNKDEFFDLVRNPRPFKDFNYRIVPEKAGVLNA